MQSIKRKIIMNAQDNVILDYSDKTASKIMRFFDLHPKSQVLPSLNDYLKAHEDYENVNVNDILKILNSLEFYGYIQCYGSHGSVLSNQYQTVKFGANAIGYGQYYFLTEGFDSINVAFSSTIKAVSSTIDDQQKFGTGFFVGNEYTFVTSAGLIANSQCVAINDSDGNPLKCQIARINKDADLAMLLLHNQDVVKPFRLGSSKNSFDRALIFGYSHLGGKEPIKLLYPMETFNKVGLPQLHEEDEPFLPASPEGVNILGWPVIDRCGLIIGTITMPTWPGKKPLAVPGVYISRFVDSNSQFSDVEIEDMENGFRLKIDSE